MKITLASGIPLLALAGTTASAPSPARNRTNVIFTEELQESSYHNPRMWVYQLSRNVDSGDYYHPLGAIGDYQPAVALGYYNKTSTANSTSASTNNTSLDTNLSVNETGTGGKSSFFSISYGFQPKAYS